MDSDISKMKKRPISEFQDFFFKKDLGPHDRLDTVSGGPSNTPSADILKIRDKMAV